MNNNGTVTGEPNIPLWALILGAIGFVCGIVTLGSRTISTVGTKITRLTPSKSFATQIGAAVAVMTSSALGDELFCMCVSVHVNVFVFVFV